MPYGLWIIALLKSIGLLSTAAVIGPEAEQSLRRFIMAALAALCNRAGHIYFHPVVSYSSFFFPHLISAVGDWMSTILPVFQRGVALV